MTTSSPQPGIYTKGDQVRVADTAADAVKYTFDGFKRQVDEDTEPAGDGPQDGGQFEPQDAPEGDQADTGAPEPESAQPLDEPHQHPVDDPTVDA